MTDADAELVKDAETEILRWIHGATPEDRSEVRHPHDVLCHVVKEARKLGYSSGYNTGSRRCLEENQSTYRWAMARAKGEAPPDFSGEIG